MDAMDPSRPGRKRIHTAGHCGEGEIRSAGAPARGRREDVRQGRPPLGPAGEGPCRGPRLAEPRRAAAPPLGCRLLLAATVHDTGEGLRRRRSKLDPPTSVPDPLEGRADSRRGGAEAVAADATCGVRRTRQPRQRRHGPVDGSRVRGGLGPRQRGAQRLGAPPAAGPLVRSGAGRDGPTQAERSELSGRWMWLCVARASSSRAATR